MKLRHVTLNESGFSWHFALPIVVVVAVIGIGAYTLMGSHAATSCYSRQFSYGSGGSCVTDIQVLSNYYRFGTSGRRHWIAADGDFGPATKSAVISVQKSAHISQDGIVGKHTWGVLCGAGGSRGTANGNAAHNAGCPGY